MKREETVYICERCGGDIRVTSRKFGPFHLSGKLPKDWNNLKDPDNKYMMSCNKCVSDFKQSWNKYMTETPSSKKKK